MSRLPRYHRRRGGSLFTMILFIMMLASTGLMYYYFQRARALERDLYAIKRGEMDPEQAGRSFLGHLPDINDSPRTAPAVSATPAVVIQNTPEPTTTPQNQAISGEPVGAATTHPPPATAHNERLQLEPLTEDPTHDFEPADDGQTHPGQRSDEEPGATSDIADQDAPEQAEDTEASGASLYDMEPPTVRVRAPRRD